MPESISPALAGLGLGIALAGAPGPVQAVLLSEALRGGTGRGFRAMAGANLTLGVLLVALALGVSVAAPSGTALRLLKVVGGALLVFFGLDGFLRAGASAQSGAQARDSALSRTVARRDPRTDGLCQPSPWRAAPHRDLGGAA